MEGFNFFTDDWKKIPQNYRFIIIAGLLLIFNSWLLDHWDIRTTPVYMFWGRDIRSIGYSIGLTLIIFCFLLLILKQFLNTPKLIMYRKKYPIEKLNIDFFLTSFRGKVILFDIKEKKFYHIFPWTTAEDLLLVGLWNYLEKDFPPEQEDLLQVGHTNRYRKFKDFDDGGIINTR